MSSRHRVCSVEPRLPAQSVHTQGIWHTNWLIVGHGHLHLRMRISEKLRESPGGACGERGCSIFGVIFVLDGASTQYGLQRNDHLSGITDPPILNTPTVSHPHTLLHNLDLPRHVLTHLATCAHPTFPCSSQPQTSVLTCSHL